MEEPISKEHDLQLVRTEVYPVIDISYVELPERVTHRVNLGNILGGFSFLSMLMVPGAVEGENYILAIGLIAACWICEQLAVREYGKRK